MTKLRAGALATLLAIALTAFGTSADAQSDGETPPPSAHPIEAADGLTGSIVSVRIATPLRGEDPWARMGLSHGAPFSAERARDALRHALASGTFASASVSARAVPGGVELTLRGERRYRLTDFEIAGASEREPDLSREDADLHPDMTVTEATVEDARVRVVEAYRAAGYPEARCAAEWAETDTPGARSLIFRIREGTPSRTRALELTGLTPELAAEARDAIGMRVGDLASPQRVRVGEENLATWLRRAGFLDLRVSSAVDALPEGGVRARYEVTPGARYVMTWQGVHAAPEASLVEALRMAEEQGYTESTLASFSARVQDFYVRRGWYDARVSATLASETPAERTVRFRVVEGRQVFVRTLAFRGATVLSERELTDVVERAARNELPVTPRLSRGIILRARTYTPGVYSTAAQRIVETYRERGYLDAAVDAPVPVRADTPEGPRFDITMRVTEGPRSFVEELVFEGNRAQPGAALAEAWAMPVGVPLLYREVSEARVRLADWYHEQGYAFARIEPEIERSPDHTRARVKVVVHEGPRVRIGRVELRGNRVTRAFVLRARMALAEGGVYSLTALRTSQRQLYELGVFTSVNVGLEDGDIEAPVKTLLVRVVEDRRVSFEARVGFSLGQGARVGLQFSFLNLGGLAMNLSVRPEAGYLLPLPVVAPNPSPELGIPDWGDERVSGRLPVSLAFPYIPGLGPKFSASVDVVMSRTLQPWSLDLLTLGIGGTLAYRPVPRLSLSLTSEVQRIDVGLFGADSITASLQRTFVQCRDVEMLSESTCMQRQLVQRQNLLRYSPGLSDLAALRLGVVWDGRDNPLTPTRGFYASATGELLFLIASDQVNVTLRPSDRTFHLDARLTGYVPLPVAHMVLALSARGGRNFALAGSDNTHPSRLFWLGGAGSMRGWIQNQLIPQDTVDEALAASGDTRNAILAGVQGGEFYLNFVADLRIPTGFCPFTGTCLEVGAFVDLGNVWRKPPDLPTNGDQWERFLRFSPGVGVRLTSPVGIIALDVGFVPFYHSEVGENWLQTVQFYLGNTL